ncbi:shikimate kinase [Flavihumibacter sp. R14]|nr:shikimate kinase [Flavihumibacter soli]
MKIFLTGFMGSGKSTVGKRLATYLQYDFVDLDKLIEKEAGMKIPEYFSRHGEAAFRDFERDVLQQTRFSENTVIATGGGAPCYHDNMEWMNREGKVVYLHMEPKALASRLKNSKGDRPLLNGLNEEEMIAFITEKLASREGFYRRAKVIVSGLDLTAEKLAAYLDLPAK